MHTRESQKLVGVSPCRCESCPADHFSAVARSDSTRAPFNFQAVRSGLLRFYARGCRFKSDPSLHLREGSSMVEHVIVLWSAFSWFPFLGSEGKDTSLQLEARAWREPWLQIRAPVSYVSKRREGLQGTLPMFLPELISEAVRMQLLRQERLHFDGAGRWFNSNRFSHGSRSSDQNLCSAFSSDSLRGQ